MRKYFDKNSIEGTRDEVIRRVAERYIKANPSKKYIYHAFNAESFKRGDDARCIIDFNEKFPEAKNGDYAYAVAGIYSETEKEMSISATFRSPAEIYINGEECARTVMWDECVDNSRIIEFKAKAGMNTVFIKCRKNPLGFKVMLGCCNPKWDPINFYTVLSKNDGSLGWNWCGPFDEDIFAEVPNQITDIDNIWLPKQDNFVFKKADTAYAVSFCRCETTSSVKFTIDINSRFTFYIDGAEVGKERIQVCDLEAGEHRLSVRIENPGADTVFECKCEGAQLYLPGYIKGVHGKWLYLDSGDERAKKGFDEFTVYDGGEYFQCAKNTYLRPVLEAELFGKSNYPIGVVLYGLLTAGRCIGDERIIKYAHEHLAMCCRINEYAVMDTEKYGYACLNHQLMMLGALDDCGSFMATALEDYLKYSNDESVLGAVDYVGNYILNIQERLENGMFYREQKGTFMQYTVWADDLYMSVPFLIRYSALKNDKSILDDAVNQLLCFRELLYIEDKKLMSHVYNIRYGLPTNIPWGRGNGWALFTLSELLGSLDRSHEKYGEIEQFFIDLSEGFLKLQDQDGMLHQVLDDQDSYAEASCTAMCAASFARGVKLGILKRDIYSCAAKKAVEALRKFCIDEEGNVYGVCIGSGYSYRPEYYKNELPWNINDTHGTGIILIALAEAQNL